MSIPLVPAQLLERTLYRVKLQYLLKVGFFEEGFLSQLSVRSQWPSKFQVQLLLWCTKSPGPSPSVLWGTGARRQSSGSALGAPSVTPGWPWPAAEFPALGLPPGPASAGAVGIKQTLELPRLSLLSLTWQHLVWHFKFPLLHPFPSQAEPSPNGNKDEICKRDF